MKYCLLRGKILTFFNSVYIMTKWCAIFMFLYQGSRIIYISFTQFTSVRMIWTTADSKLNTDTHRGDEEGEIALGSSSTLFKTVWVSVQWAYVRLMV